MIRCGTIHSIRMSATLALGHPSTPCSATSPYRRHLGSGPFLYNSALSNNCWIDGAVYSLPVRYRSVGSSQRLWPHSPFLHPRILVPTKALDGLIELGQSFTPDIPACRASPLLGSENLSPILRPSAPHVSETKVDSMFLTLPTSYPSS